MEQVHGGVFELPQTGVRPVWASHATARHRMIWYAARKLLGLVVTLLVAAAIVFLVLDVLPGDPARFILGLNATDEGVAALREQLGMNLPVWARFFGWLGGMLKGDFGLSYTQGAPVGALIAGRLAVTLPLTLMAMVLAAAIGLPLGLLGALRRGSLADRMATWLERLGVAVPDFWLGMVLVLALSVGLHWLPPGGFVPWSESPGGAFASLILPALALALPQAAVLALAARAALAAARRSDYVRSARARGLTLRKALWRHGARNGLLAVLGVLGPQFAHLVMGTVIVENVFYLPGLGRLIFDAVGAHDLVLVRGGIMILLVWVAGTLFLCDLGTAWADPRLRERSGE